MADILPFCGVHYNPAVVGDLAAVICPPYDIITPQMQQEFYERGEYNFVRLELSRESPRDDDSNNKYSRASATLAQWLEQSVLVKDEKPAVYLHDHYFTYQGREYRRRGIIVTVRLGEWSKTAVHPHEDTMPGPKSDRLNLLRALQANTSSIFTLFEDPGRQVSILLEAQEQGKPILSTGNIGGENHCIWAISEVGVVRQICSHLATQPLYIADGHHRYESALNYRNERRTSSAHLT
ncbi:DUF1015 domain-containing protein, partial [Chloroflexota bacterium]